MNDFTINYTPTATQTLSLAQKDRKSTSQKALQTDLLKESKRKSKQFLL